MYGQVFVVFAVAVAAAEAALALALALVLYRQARSMDVSVWQSLREAGVPATVDLEPLQIPEVAQEEEEVHLPPAGLRPLDSCTEEHAGV
jgi:NADH-quinone oxidoreductase subunit K